MLPTVNGKSFLELTVEDLKTLIDNTDFRENEYIDYKKNFAFLEIPKDKKPQIAEKIAEFRSDVCAFANSEGGYLLFGISDENGCVSDIPGVEIENDDIDRFELDRRNNLMSINPKIPYIKFHFIKLESGKYVVIIYVKHDNFAPYIHIIDEKNYNIYKRAGNRKQTITYSELRNMFNQSLSLDKEIYKYRNERISYFQAMEDDDNHTYSQFLLLHIIPETFMNSSYNECIFILEKNGNYKFSDICSEFDCTTRSIPCVDGLRFNGDVNYGHSAVCHINNNKLVDPEWENRGIARYVTWPRTVCSIEGHDVNGKPLKGNYIGSDIPMADGFIANAVFFKLGFLDKIKLTIVNLLIWWYLIKKILYPLILLFVDFFVLIIVRIFFNNF